IVTTIVSQNTSNNIATKFSGKQSVKKFMLLCGLFSSLLYVAMNIIVPMYYPGYSSASQTVSELSAVDAPTRSLWVIPGTIYTLLMVAFGWGVWNSVKDNRKLRTVGSLLIIYGLLGIGWPLAPMHQREVIAAGGGTLSDTMHIVFSIVTSLLMLLAMGFGSMALGRRFRFYSILTIQVLLVFGVMTAFEAPQLESNLPTPMLGVWERILIGVFLLWVMVLAVTLLTKTVDRVDKVDKVDKVDRVDRVDKVDRVHRVN
ncbi:MAG: DUF998 domain-containing protein, partial [Flavitalea sp.]